MTQNSSTKLETAVQTTTYGSFAAASSWSSGSRAESAESR